MAFGCSAERVFHFLLLGIYPDSRYSRRFMTNQILKSEAAMRTAYVAPAAASARAAAGGVVFGGLNVWTLVIG